MGNNKSKDLNNETNNSQLNNIQEEKKFNFELEIEIFKEGNDEKEIFILCDINKLIEDNKLNEKFYKKNKIIPPKEFDYFNELNTKLYLNDIKVKFNYKLKINKFGINKIKIFSNIKLFSLSSMFYNCIYIKKINFIKINNKNINDMSYIFYNCCNLSEVNLSSFNTNNVSNMSYMFFNCYKISALNLSSFNTNNVTNMNCMFYNCYNLSELNLSSFKTYKVTNMSYMFYNCKKLYKLDLHSFNTHNVIKMNYMFSNCENLSKLNLSTFITKKS